MEKKELKWYDAPTMEVVELEAKVSLLAGSLGAEPGGDNGDNDDGSW